MLAYDASVGAFQVSTYLTGDLIHWGKGAVFIVTQHFIGLVLEVQSALAARIHEQTVPPPPDWISAAPAPDIGQIAGV